MSPLRVVLLFLLACSACYAPSEPNRVLHPACAADRDCPGGGACAGGTCEWPCATTAACAAAWPDAPTAALYCNGYCRWACPVGTGYRCPGSLPCRPDSEGSRTGFCD